jgi:hypothetical protein
VSHNRRSTDRQRAVFPEGEPSVEELEKRGVAQPTPEEEQRRQAIAWAINFLPFREEAYLLKANCGDCSASVVREVSFRGDLAIAGVWKHEFPGYNHEVTRLYVRE